MTWTCKCIEQHLCGKTNIPPEILFVYKSLSLIVHPQHFPHLKTGFHPFSIIHNKTVHPPYPLTLPLTYFFYFSRNSINTSVRQRPLALGFATISMLFQAVQSHCSVHSVLVPSTTYIYQPRSSHCERFCFCWVSQRESLK